MNLLLIILVSMLLSAFFSGMEIAILSANRLKLELDKKQNKFYSGIISYYTKNPGHFIATMMVGNNLAMVTYGLAFAKFIEPYLIQNLQSVYLVILAQILASTIIVLITIEYLPKMIFRINPNGHLRFFIIPVGFFYFLLYPLTKLIMILSKGFLMIFTDGSTINSNENNVFSRVDLDQFVKEPENRTNTQSVKEVDNEVKLFRNALDFSKVKLRDIIVPRTEMFALDIDSSVEELRQMFIDSGYSRIIFYSGNIDNIVGYVHHSVFFTHPDAIKSNLRRVIIAPESMSASKLLSQFIQNRLSIAVVVDEFGGTSGMVTSEDILEEIFGEIEDEHDTIDLINKQISPAEFVLSARLELDELNEMYQLDFQESDNYETLAGFILFYHESIPKPNTIINIGNYKFKILKASNTKIELVKLTIPDKI
jgi:CBS domain containing-hemolysin-like protein